MREVGNVMISILKIHSQIPNTLSDEIPLYSSIQVQTTSQ